jgi:hypothetical protein
MGFDSAPVPAWLTAGKLERGAALCLLPFLLLFLLFLGFAAAATASSFFCCFY